MGYIPGRLFCSYSAQMNLSPDEVARRCAELLWQEDHAARALDILIDTVTADSATLRMGVRQDMVNGHGTCHGAYLFAIADTAFAYACNARNQRAVAGGADISFIAPAFLGDTLTATAQMRQQGGRSGVYDVEVSDQHGKLIALFRGRCVRIKQQFFAEHAD